ncbi:MAG TPA: TraR/DksA family transcriptional regulator [Frankiaceae bacterium]|jgi:RNA polymerase-binding transcription factor DksA|nr:TraR/DksA family transcriptional regulator [Frankiaceae bacterium]
MRDALVSDRARAAEQVAALEAQWASLVAASEDSNADDEHDPEGATIGFERAQLTALLDAARARVAGIDAALARVDDGSYGACERCGAPIGAERLAALPATRLCIACAAGQVTE